MMRDRYPFKNAALFILACLALLSSCAKPIQESPPAAQWQCDPWADQAVQSGDWEKAQVLHELFLMNQPSNCLALYHLGYIRGKLGERQEEVDLYNQALDCGYDRDVQLYFNLGMAYADLGQTAQALSVFQRAAAIEPDNADIHFGTGLMAFETEQPVLAENELNRAISLDSRHWEARLTLARLYLDQSRWKLARSQLEQVQKGDPENPQTRELLQILEDRRSGQY